MKYLFIFIVAFLPFYFLLYLLKSQAKKRAATYSLYAARDKFVLLVAEGVIAESDPVFEYYYPRINAILAEAPNIGINHVINAMLKSKSSDIEKAIGIARAKAKEVNSSKSMEDARVKEAVRCYLEASKFMILSHSSLLKLIYTACKNADRFPWLIKTLSHGTGSGSSYVNAARVANKYNDSELDLLAVA